MPDSVMAHHRSMFSTLHVPINHSLPKGKLQRPNIKIKILISDSWYCYVS